MAEMTEEQKKRAEAQARKTEEIYAECNRIDDPVRRGLCKVCGTPVAGNCHSASSTSYACHSPPGAGIFHIPEAVAVVEQMQYIWGGHPLRSPLSRKKLLLEETIIVSLLRYAVFGVRSMLEFLKRIALDSTQRSRGRTPII